MTCGSRYPEFALGLPRFGSAFVLLGLLLACEREPKPPMAEAVGQADPRSSGAISEAVSETELHRLAPGQDQRRSIASGEVHTYLLDLDSRQLLQLDAEQLKGDLSLAVIGPAGEEMLRVDHETQTKAVEQLIFIAETVGEHRLQVEIWKTDGEYRIRRGPSREPTSTERDRAEAEKHFSAAVSLQRKNPTEAARSYLAAAEFWQRLGDEPGEARARYELGRVLKRLPERGEGRAAACDRARELYQRLGNSRRHARCLHCLGAVASGREEFATARELYAEALGLWRQVGELHEVSILAYDLARVERRLGQPEAALQHFREALEAVRHNASPTLHEARIRAELGGLYQYRGQSQEGIQEMRRSLLALGPASEADSKAIKRQRAVTLTRLANALAALATEEALTEAGEKLEEVRRLRADVGDPEGVAVAVNSLGLWFEKMNRPQQALAAFEEAEDLFRGLEGEAANAAVVHGNRCRIVERLGKLGVARDCYLEALDMLRLAKLQNASAQALFDLAKNARRRNALHEARVWIGEALEIVEAIRDESRNSDLRSSFLDRKVEYYELAIDLALDLHAADPQAGHSAEAFRLLESARARGFLESLSRFRPEIEAPPEVAALRHAIHRAKVESLTLEGKSAAEVERLETALFELLEQLHLRNPRRGFDEPVILSAGEVRQLLDSETVLLEYYLGEDRSAVWAITESRVVWRPLPSRAKIESLARELYEALRGGAHRIRSWKLDRLSSELSALILQPVADLLDRPRLAVVPDGALRYIPFAALPHPRGQAVIGSSVEPLLLTHQVTSIPSASVLAALRTRVESRAPNSGLMALVAAPVVHPGDERLAAEASASTAGARAVRGTAPLPYAAEEAAAILAMTAGENVESAIGFAATRDFVFSDALQDVRIVHFATHGHLDDAHGELSGLMLSQFDEAGRRTDGYLWAYETYSLSLAADLVVLSACDTALGESIRGEGLVGLTRGFLYAGAARVLVSKWSVNDKSTARLMEAFYRGLLREHLGPAEALRQAQIELKSSGFAAPFYWAAFGIEGDWSPAPRGLVVESPQAGRSRAPARKKNQSH